MYCLTPPTVTFPFCLVPISQPYRTGADTFKPMVSHSHNFSYGGYKQVIAAVMSKSPQIQCLKIFPNLVKYKEINFIYEKCAL